MVAPVADTKDEAPGLAALIVLAAAAAGDAAAAAGAAGAPAAGAAAGVAAVKKQKKRKPQFSPNPNEDPTTSQEETDDDMGNVVPPTPPPPAPLEGLRSPTEPFTLTELEDMHNKIVQKCAKLIYGFSALNIYEVSYVEQKLKEIKSAFKKDYDRNNALQIMTITMPSKDLPSSFHYTSSSQSWWQKSWKFMLLEDGCVRQPSHQLRVV